MTPTLYYSYINFQQCLHPCFLLLSIRDEISMRMGSILTSPPLYSCIDRVSV
jgi:hypothetical protein